MNGNKIPPERLLVTLRRIAKRQRQERWTDKIQHQHKPKEEPNADRKKRFNPTLKPNIAGS